MIDPPSTPRVLVRKLSGWYSYCCCCNAVVSVFTYHVMVSYDMLETASCGCDIYIPACTRNGDSEIMMMLIWNRAARRWWCQIYKIWRQVRVWYTCFLAFVLLENWLLRTCFVCLLFSCLLCFSYPVLVRLDCLHGLYISLGVPDAVGYHGNLQQL